MKTTEINTIAKIVKTTVEKQKKFPTSVTLGKKKYNYGEIAYIFGVEILHINKDITPINCAKAVKPTGQTIYEKIYPSDYKDQAKRIVQFIKQNGKCPNYVTTVKSHKKVRPQDFIYAFARIIVFYFEKHILPAYCLYNSSIYGSSSKGSTSKIRKYGRSTKTGCDNRGQNNGYYCACHMAQEIIRNLTGIVIPQSKIAQIMGTTSEGTGHSGIDTFFAWFNRNYTNYQLTWVWKYFSEVGWNGIKRILESSNQDCGLHELYRNTWGHYTNFDKVYTNTVDVHNSLGSYCNNGCYCGYTENRTKSEAQSYLNGISQKSVIIVTRKK